MSSPSPPPLPISRSRKPRTTSPHPSTGSHHSRSRSQSRPPPSPAPPSSVLRQPSNASSNASSATYVEPMPTPSWRQRSRDARHAEPSPSTPVGAIFPSSRDAYISTSQRRPEMQMPQPTPARPRQSTINDRDQNAYTQPHRHEPPRFIVQSPSTSSMDRESNATSWSQPSARESRSSSSKVRPPVPATYEENDAHIRTSSAAVPRGLRSPADLTRPSSRSSSKTPSKRREQSVSPQATPTLPPPSPTFEYGGSSPQLTPSLRSLSPAPRYSPQPVTTESPQTYAYDDYGRSPAGDNTREKTRDDKRSRAKSGTIAASQPAPAVPPETRQFTSTKHARQRSVTPTLIAHDQNHYQQETVLDDRRRSKSAARAQTADAASVMPSAPPMPPRHPSLASPMLGQAAAPPPLPPRRPSPVVEATAFHDSPSTVPPSFPPKPPQPSFEHNRAPPPQNTAQRRERTMSHKDAKPLKPVTAEELATALPYDHSIDPANQEVERVKRERTTTWTAGQTFGSSFAPQPTTSENANIPGSDMRKRERTRSAGAEKENVRPSRERTKSAATTMQSSRNDIVTQDFSTGKRGRTKSGGAVLQDSSRRDTVSDDMHAILMGQMPESQEEITNSRHTPRRQSSRGSVHRGGEDDSDTIARNRAEALAALSAPNTPKTKAVSGKKSRPTTPAETLHSSESTKLKGLGMNIAFPDESQQLGRTPMQKASRSNVPHEARAPSPAPDYSHLFAALADPYTSPVGEGSPVQVPEPEGDDFTQSEYDSEVSHTNEDAYENEEEVIWDGSSQERHNPEEPVFQPSPQVGDLQRKSSTLRPPTLKKALTSSTSVSSLAWSGDEEVEKGINSAASKLLAGLHDVPEEPEDEIDDGRYQSHVAQQAASVAPNMTATLETVHIPNGKETSNGSERKSWRSTLSSTAAYQSLLDRHGSLEMQRQEHIFELVTTESAFVHDMRLVIRLFIQPLRDRSQPPTWIPGVPPDVGRLFDWLDDIVQLHAEFARVLHSMRRSQYPVVLSCASQLLPLVAKLEVHQPYLVRLEETSRTIESMMKQPESDFGEFLRMQSVSDEWDGLSLTSWLLKPVQRLSKYALLFRQILQSTPRNHPDHLASLSLYYTTETVIGVMQEVKAREEEYDMVRMLAARMAGLPPHFRLAQRGRRLLAQGPLVRLQPEESTSREVDGRHMRPTGRDAGRTGTYDPRLSRQSVNYSDGSSYDWPSTPSLAPPGSPYSSADGLSVTRTPPPGHVDYFSRHPSRPGSIKSVSSDERVCETSIYAFLFSDVVVLGTPLSDRNPLLQNTRRSKRAPQWQLLPDLGLARVLSSTSNGQRFGFDFVLAVDLLPVSAEDALYSEESLSATIYLTLPDGSPEDAKSLEAMKKTWTNAFESCVSRTLRSIAFPSIRPFQMPLEFGLCGDRPASPSCPTEIPRSPSILRQCPTNAIESERGEREWWSHRFKQVAEEFMHDRNFKPTIVEVPSVPQVSRNRIKDRASRQKRASIMHRAGPVELVTASNVDARVRGRDTIVQGDNHVGLLGLLSRRGR